MGHHDDGPASSAGDGADHDGPQPLRWLFGLTVAHVTSYAALAFVVQSIAHANLRLPRHATRYASLVARDA